MIAICLSKATSQFEFLFRIYKNKQFCYLEHQLESVKMSSSL